jgi:hypothetical protein
LGQAELDLGVGCNPLKIRRRIACL